MKIIDNQLLNEISEQARKSPRLRMNHNLHRNLDDKSQRLLNALEPGTLLPVHRHALTDETYILLRGKIRVALFNNAGKEAKSYTLDTKQGVFGINIPAGQWHTIEVIETGSVIYETKDGPYTPLTEKDILK